MPLTTIFTSCSSIETFGRGISEFVGLKVSENSLWTSAPTLSMMFHQMVLSYFYQLFQEYPSYVTPQDPAVETPSGYNVTDKVAIWTKNGKRTIDATRFVHSYINA